MNRKGTARWTGRLLVTLAAGVVAGNTFAQGLAGEGDEYSVIYSGELIDGQLSNVTRTPIPADAVTYAPARAPKEGVPIAADPPRKVHPRLDEWVRTRPGHELAKVVIVFNEDVTVPRMPFLEGTQSRDSDENHARLAAIQAQVDAIKALRAPRYEEKARSLNRDFGARVEQRFWLINGVQAEVPIAAIEGIARRPDVASVEPEDSTVTPGNHYLSNGRARINSDPYFNAGLTSGYIGFIDSGVRNTHVLHSSPTHLAFRYDCTDGVCDWLGDPADSCNHGTGVAAILTGNDNKGNAHRGVTAITVDSFKVLVGNGDGTCTGDSSHTVLAYQAAISAGDRVISISLAGGTNESDSLAMAADNAFDTNRIIVAAAGNDGPGAGTVRSPAVAHKVIAVGAEDVVSTSLEPYSGRGPTPDGRAKPDLVAPTNSIIASNASDTATWAPSGTSFAAPYVAGAAMLVSNWFQQQGVFDAGHAYATLIAFGNNATKNTAYDNNRGAGRLVLASGTGRLSWGKLAVGDGVVFGIPVTVSSNRTKLDVAIWWPESAAQTHNDIDLKLVNPAGTTVATSTGLLGVFEKVNYDSSSALATGSWHVVVSGASVASGSPQTVYYAFYQR